ncbi:hypothetical protein SAMN04489721_2415 [Agromyces flavus]|uniref:Uncharacterized protein n=1 Tax=Agromyces flavus TaxID=589382 RepID=A0A1H1X790_9MICO|nr:hypothetical protein GCM10010932_04900 [Agromyces flavus]SDT05154.1 hypothetical protein SAMN04489721_2415 [Agromyces flavus]
MEGVTHDEEVGGTRRDQARARARSTRARRLGTAGLALFVIGPVLGLALVVLGVVLAFGDVPWWPLAIIAAVVIGLVLHHIGLRMLLVAEEARTPAPPDPDPSDAKLDGPATDQASPARTNPDS